MNAARAAALALIACAGVAIPATTANADDPLLCGLLAACEAESGGDGGGGDDSEPAPVDDGGDIDLDLGLGIDTEVDTEVDVGVDVELFPDSGTLLTADTDVDQSRLELEAVDHTVGLGSESALDTDASIGHDGIVMTGNGRANAQAVATTWRKLVGVDAANHFCGVQVVIAAESSATCQPNAAADGGSGNTALIAVAESVDLCGAHVVLAGSATTGCGDSSPTAPPEAGSSWTLADAAAAGTLCGVSIAVAGESDTTCAGTAQEAPVPSDDPDGSGPGTLGTGATGAVEGAGSSPAAGGQSAQPAAAPNDEGNSGTTSGESRGSLPLTGTSVLLFLTLAAAVVATGLVAVRSSRVRVGHQS